MKFLLILFFSIFILSACGDTTDNGEGDNNCAISADCGENMICYSGSCYAPDDPVFGKKNLQIIGNPQVELVSGETATLKVQMVRSPIKDPNNPEQSLTPQELVGPIQGETINFTIAGTGDSDVTPGSAITEMTGIVTVTLTGLNSTTQSKEFNIMVTAEGCTQKMYTITVNPRSKTLRLVSDEVIEVYVNSTRTLIAQVLTNNNYPYEGEDVTFSIQSGTPTASLEPSSAESDFTGMASVELNSGETPGNLTILVESDGTQSKQISVTVKERTGSGCLTNEDCTHLGEAYECDTQSGVCIYVPIPCTSDDMCPENFECEVETGECKEIPYVCDVVNEPDCRCLSDENCPDLYNCVRGFCVEEEISCETNTDCPAGLICVNQSCEPVGSECKSDLNCNPTNFPERCPTADSCICQDGFCVNPCPDSDLIELSGGSGDSCSSVNTCGEDSEVCFDQFGLNKCIQKWDADYYFHLIEALPEVLQDVLNTLGTVFGPISDFFLGELDLGLPGWLSWLKDIIIGAVADVLDDYIPSWVVDLIHGLNDTIEILQEMKVKATMAFVHNENPHSYLKGMEMWNKFFIKWRGNWKEVEPEQEGDFQFNSSGFTGNIQCNVVDGEPQYTLYIDRHSAEFYFGKFVKAFLESILIPAVTSNRAHTLDEALDLFIDCEQLSEDIMDVIRDIAGDFADYLSFINLEPICESLKDQLANTVYTQIERLSFGDVNGSNQFTFDGYATIEHRRNVGRELYDGKYNGTLDLDRSRNFSADWEAEKDR